jgi:hypothetical protein
VPMGKTAPRKVPRPSAAALRSKAQHGASALSTGIADSKSALRDKASGASVASVASALNSNTAKSRRHVKATATIAKGVVSGASEHVKVHVKSHVGHLKRPHGKTASMEELAALAEQLSWSADELQECLRAFGGCMAETAQHMEAQLDLVGRDDQLVNVSVVQAAFSGTGELGLRLAPGRSGGAIVVEVERDSPAYSKPQLVPGLALIEVQGHTVQGLRLKQINELLRVRPPPPTHTRPFSRVCVSRLATVPASRFLRAAAAWHNRRLPGARCNCDFRYVAMPGSLSCSGTECCPVPDFTAALGPARRPVGSWR